MLAVLVGLIYAEDGNEVVVGSDEGLKGVKSNIDKGYLTNFNDNGKIYHELVVRISQTSKDFKIASPPKANTEIPRLSARVG